MEWVLGWIVFQLFIFVLILVISNAYDKRYKDKKQNAKGMYNGSLVPTSEIYLDPKDGLRYRVYFNKDTGEREYILEE